jgi:hypothetical protein
MAFDIPIDPTLLPRVIATTTTPPQAAVAVDELSTALPPPPPPLGEVLVIPQRDEHGQLTSSGYAFRESLWVF